MIQYIIKRLLQTIPVLIGVSIIVFAIMRTGIDCLARRTTITRITVNGVFTVYSFCKNLGRTGLTRTAGAGK